MNQDQFKSKMEATLECNYMKILKEKPHDKQFLNYTDVQVLTGTTRNLFRGKLSQVPDNIEFACHSAEAILAPDLTTKQQHVKAMYGVAGGVGGLAAVLTGLAGIFGWGAGVLTMIKVFFVGAALGGPIAWIAGGITVASIATYFALVSDDVEKSAKAFKALKVGVVQAIGAIWPEHGDALSK